MPGGRIGAGYQTHRPDPAAIARVGGPAIGQRTAVGQGWLDPAEMIDLVLPVSRHEAYALAFFEFAVKDAHQSDHSAEGVVPRVED